MKNQQENILLSFIQKECDYSKFKLVEKDDLMALFGKQKLDYESLDELVLSLEKKGYIKIKYEDDSFYCISLAKQKQEEKREKKHSLFLTYFLTILASFLGGFIGAFLSKII